MKIERSAGTWYPNLSKLFFFVCFLVLTSKGSLKAQEIIFQEDFEAINPGGIGTWQSMYFGNAPSTNYNIFAVQSGCDINRISGTRSMQVTGISSGFAYCDYVNNPNTNAPLIVHEIDATNYEDITLSYKWKCRGQNGNDYGQLYYSLDGTNYTLLENNLRINSTSTQTVTDYILPAAVENTTFFIGWAFRADSADRNQPGLTIDDIIIEGIAICDPINATAEDYVICEGSETTLNVTSSGSHTYTWYEDYNSATNTGTQIGTGNSINVSPEENTLYAVVSDCGSYDFVSVVAIPAPTLVTPSPIEVNNCESDEVIHELTMSGGIIPVTALSETFNPDSSIPWLVSATSFGGNPTTALWGLYTSSPTFLSNDNSDFVMVNSDAHGNFTMESSLISPTFSLADYSTPINLNFYHYYRHITGAGQTGRVEISTDLGNTWTTLHTYDSTTHGEPTIFTLANINLDAYAGAQTVNIRFRFNSTWGYYWAIDNVSITGTPNPTTITWSPEEGLYTDANATVPYTGDSRTTVYAMPENSTIYTVTSTSSVGCETTAEVDITGGISIWDGAQWVNSISPSDDRKAVFRGDYNSLGDIEACSVLIESGDVVINANHTLTIENGLTVNDTNGSLTIESDANLIQIDNDAVNDARIKVKREITSIHNTSAQMDYVYWSAPVTGQDLKTFSPGTPNNRFYQYNEATDYFVPTTLPSDFIAGKGYAIRAEAGLTNGQNKTYDFVGEINNGNLNHNISIIKSTEGQGYNLVGNPYPSNIDAELLFAANPSIHTSVFFWSNNNYDAPNQQGSSYSGSNYSVYNGTGGNPATYSETYEATEVPNGVIKAGQGFIVQKENIGTSTLVFDNNMRISDAGIFYEKASKDRFWLTLTTPSQLVKTTLIGFIPGAVDEYDPNYDAEHLGGSDAIFTTLGTRQLVIQGLEYPLEKRDVIALGVRHYEGGTYIIDLQSKEGIFAENQKIYLKDKYLNRVHNLSNLPYRYRSAAGEFTDRFEIIFKSISPPSYPVLTTGNQVNIQKINQQIVISSEKEKIFSVEIFNLAGWSVYRNENVQSNELRVPATQFDKEIIVVKVLTETGELVTKKFINK